MTRDASILGALAAALFVVGCASTDAQVSTVYAPGFTPNAMTISVLGVFKDGRMNEDAWAALDPDLPAPFRSDRCASGFGSLLDADPDLFAEIDGETMEGGITQEIIDHVAPAANAKAILLISTWGMVSTEHQVAGAPATAPTPGMSGRRGRGGGGGGRRAQGPRTVGDPGVVKMTASVYSIPTHTRLAILTVKYTGNSPSGAIKTFEQELAKLLAGSTCAEWTWKRVTATSSGPPL